MFTTDAALKQAYAERLRQEGQGVVLDMPADEQGGTIDILSDREIIFCALELTEQSAIALKSRLNFYQKFAPSRTKVALVQTVTSTVAADQLAASGISVVSFSPSSSQAPSQPTKRETQSSPIPVTPPPKQTSLYHYPELNSVDGGDGLPVVITALGVVLLLGLIGFVIF